MHTTGSVCALNDHFCMKYTLNLYLNLYVVTHSMEKEPRAQRYEVTELKPQGWGYRMMKADFVQTSNIVSSDCGRQ